MSIRTFARWSLSVFGVMMLVAPASAQIVVSSNDNKAVWVNGVNTVPANPKPDTVTIIDLGVSPPRIIGEVNAPGGWSAPPQSVAVAPDESIALVASSARLDPSNPSRTVFNDVLTVVDLKATPPAVIATLRTGEYFGELSLLLCYLGPYAALGYDLDRRVSLSVRAREDEVRGILERHGITVLSARELEEPVSWIRDARVNVWQCLFVPPR